MRRPRRINDSIALILLAIIALAPLPLGSNRPVYWMLSASIVFFTAGIFLLGSRPRGFQVPIKRLWLPLGLGSFYVAYMGLQASGVLFSVAPNAALLAALRTASYATFFFLVLQVASNPERAWRMMEALFFSVLFYGVIGFLAHYNVIQFPESLISSQQGGGAKSTFVNQNSFATYLGFGFLTGLALITRRIRHLRTAKISVLQASDLHLAIYFISVLVIFVTLLATTSRMGVAAVLIASSFFLFIRLGKRLKIGRVAAISGVLVVVCALIAAAYFYGGALPDQLSSVERDADVRLTLYRQVWDMILARPWGGYGADSFEMAYQKFHQLPVNPDVIWDKAHNSYLTNWAETGFIFGSVPILMLALAFGLFCHRVFGRKQGYILPLLGMSVILQGAVHSLADFSLEIQANIYVFLAIIALALADVLREKPLGESAG